MSRMSTVVEGPVMIFLTTTAHDVDEELMNRCLVLTVNEDREQTQAIHRKQREAQTLEGLRARMRRNEIVRLHRNAQRLLKPISVVIEHLKDQGFPDAMTRTRRDHMKFLTLIQAITLLHQHQREIKTSTEDGETLEYIEATEADVKLAWELANHVLVPFARRRAAADAPPAAVDRQDGDERMRAAARSNGSITALRGATVRQYTGWGDSQLKNISRASKTSNTWAASRRAGQSFVYALNFEMDASGRPVLPGLSYGANRSRSEEGVSRFEAGVTPSGHGPGHGGVAGWARVKNRQQ